MTEEKKPPKVTQKEKETAHICPVCGVTFYHRGTYCTRAHKQKAYRERNKNEPENTL